jgi:hypothetical protein
LHRVNARILVTDQDSIGHSGRGWLVTDLPVKCICAKEREIHAIVPRCLHIVIHRLRPVFIVPSRDKSFETQQARTVQVCLQIGGICDVITILFQPVNQVEVPELPVKESAAAIISVGTIERNLRSTRSSSNRLRAKAVVVIKALACLVVIRPIVVCLKRIHAQLIEKIGGAGIISNYEQNVVLKACGVGQNSHKCSTGPRARHSERETWVPVANNRSQSRIRWACCLLRSLKSVNVLHQPAAGAPVPSQAIHVNRKGLRGIHRYKKCDALSFINARR